MPYFIYILKLVEGKYYVGLTKDLFVRLEQHFHKKGSKWTMLHEPISVERVIESDSCFDEDKWTKIMMQKYGIKNVRGGSYTSIELQPEEEKLLERQERTRNQACFKCGRKGHFAKRCSLNIEQKKQFQPVRLQNFSKKRVPSTFDRTNQQHFKRHNKESSQQVPIVATIKIQSESDNEIFDQLESIRSKPTKIVKKDTYVTELLIKSSTSKPKQPPE